jgi:hypothetical protein
MTEILISIILSLNALWLAVPSTSYQPLSRPEMHEFLAVVEKYHTGFAYQKSSKTVEAGYWICEKHWLNCVYHKNTQYVPVPGSYNVYIMTLPGTDNLWLGATAGDIGNRGCARTIVLNTKLLYSTNQYYDTPAWYGIIAHEFYHMGQGSRCAMPTGSVELAAEMGMYDTLYQIYQGDSEFSNAAYAALVWDLRRSAINAGAYYTLKEGGNLKDFAAKVALDDAERKRIENVDVARLYRYAPLYWGAFWTEIISDTDKIFSSPALIAPVDLSGLWEMIHAPN